MDGEKYPATGSGLSIRKSHALKGSKKSWLVGLALGEKCHLDEFRALMAVEGGPDYLAALDFSLNGKADCLPIAILGAGVRELHSEALPLLAGRRVRIYPHADANSAGDNGAAGWAQQMRSVGATVDASHSTICGRQTKHP
jgi:hypothetical protein